MNYWYVASRPGSLVHRVPAGAGLPEREKALCGFKPMQGYWMFQRTLPTGRQVRCARCTARMVRLENEATT